MIKLRDILLENDEHELINLIKSGEYILTDAPIYRGIVDNDQKKIETFQIFNIRKDRKGRDSGEMSNYIINEYIMSVHPDIPSRNIILFCTPQLSVADEYGTPFVVLPHKHAKGYYYPSDSFRVLENLDVFLYKEEPTQILLKAVSNYMNEFSYIYKFLTILSNRSHPDYAEEILDFLLEYDEKLFDEYNDFVDYQEGIERVDFKLKSSARDMMEFIQGLLEYRDKTTVIDNIETFRRMTQGDSDEMWITGDKYCLVNLGFYKKIKGIVK